MNPGLAGVIQLSHPERQGTAGGWGPSVSLSWKSDSFRAQGWLMLPKDFDPGKKYPMIVLVHGGPSSAELSRWAGSNGLSATAFSALGYFVLQPNPRGSFGQGEEFTQANRKDFGYGDLRDILAGVDTVLAKYPVDPNRVGDYRLELRRVHDHVRRDPDGAVQGGCGGRGGSRTGRAITGKTRSTSG